MSLPATSSRGEMTSHSGPENGTYSPRDDRDDRDVTVVRRWLDVGVIPLVIVVLTVLLREINLNTSNGFFIDEPFYTALAQSVAAGHLPTAAGKLFFLHPPGFSVLGAGWIHLLGGVDGTVFEQAFAMRQLNIVFSGLTAALLYSAGRRVAGTTAGVIAASIFAISPWFIRQNGYVLLETSAMTFVLAGFVLLLFLGNRIRFRRSLLVLVGLSFGYGILIKEMAVFVTILPMVILAVAPRRRGRRSVPRPGPLLSRPEAWLVAACAAVPYLLWCLVVLVTGHFAEFWEQTSSGLLRASGVTQLTGFNREGAPSFLTTILDNAPQFWTTYLMLGLGAVASLVLLGAQQQRIAERPEHRLLGAFGFGALPLLGYSVFFGANEEQFYYFLLIPSCVAVAVLTRTLWGTWTGRAVWIKRLLLALATVWVVSDLTNWVYVHTVPDDGVHQVDQWMRANVPDGTTVAVTDTLQREIFLRYNMVDDNSADALVAAGDVEYLVVFEKEVEQGYAFIAPAELETQIAGLEPVFVAEGRGGQNFYVYEIG